jgi:hypothetical protein
MINQLVAFFNSWSLLISFVTHSTIFFSMLYIAVHNRLLPNWLITPLWWLGSFSGFVAATVIVQWSIGPEHPLSYWTLGTVGATLVQVALALIGFILFFKTIHTDLCNRKDRK